MIVFGESEETLQLRDWELETSKAQMFEISKFPNFYNQSLTSGDSKAQRLKI